MEAPQEQKLEPVIILCQVKTTQKDRMIDKEDTCSVEERAAATSYKGKGMNDIRSIESQVMRRKIGLTGSGGTILEIS